MKKYLPVLLLAALSACGGQSAENVEQPPKPEFTVKFLDISVLVPKLPLGEPKISEGQDGEKTYLYPINGLPEDNFCRNQRQIPGKHARG